MLFGCGNDDISDCVISINITTPIVSGPVSICNPNGSTYNIDNLQLGCYCKILQLQPPYFKMQIFCGPRYSI